MNSKTVTMKYTKATEADFDAAFEIMSILDDPASFIESDESESFDIDDLKHCQKIIARLRELSDCSRLSRVVVSASVFLNEQNEFVNPEKSTIELHPRIVAALELAGKIKP